MTQIGESGNSEIRKAEILKGRRAAAKYEFGHR
jgi:hypothetical protein